MIFRGKNHIFVKFFLNFTTNNLFQRYIFKTIILGATETVIKIIHDFKSELDDWIGPVSLRQ